VTVEPGPSVSGPLVSGPLMFGPLMFGGAPIGGLYAPVSAEAAAATLAAAWDAGIRAFDTAPHYGVGVSERRIGEFLAGRPRDEFTVCTKVGRRLVPATGDVQGEEGFYDIPPLTRVRDHSRDGVRRSLEESLGRLGLDRVDIALIHDPDDVMEQAADERCDLDCVLVAGRYTLLDQSAAEVLFPLCQRRGVTVLAAGVFNSGILAGPGDGATYDYAPAPPGPLARARRMRDACAGYGVPLPAAALQFTLRHPAVTAAVVGARSAKEITADTSYLSTPIPDTLWAELEGLLHLAGALDGDHGGVCGGSVLVRGWGDEGGVRNRSAGDGLAELEAEPGQREVCQQAPGDAFGGGLDQPELALLQHGPDGLRHRRVVERVG
jgi:D-threo-aldose 1-dehydrogenase